MASKQKKNSAAKDEKETKNAKVESKMETTDPSPKPSISYVHLVAVSVVVVTVAMVFSCEGTLRLVGLQWIPVDPKPNVAKARVIQPDIGNFDHKLDTIPDSKVEHKQTDIKEEMEKEATIKTDIPTAVPDKVDTDKPKTDPANADMEQTKTHVKTTKPETDQKHKKPKKPKKKAYAKRNITNDLDYEIRDQLDEGDELLEQGDYREALSVYNDILLDHPESPRALWGKGCATDDKSTAHRSNTFLEEAISILQKVFQNPSTPDALLMAAGRRLAVRQEFRGWRVPESRTWQHLAKKFPLNFEIQKEFGISLLKIGDYKRAKPLFQKMRVSDPDRVIAKCLLGLTIRNGDQDDLSSLPLLEECIESGEPETVDDRFFGHLGDAYIRTGQREKADALFDLGVEKRLFLSHYQRATYNADTPITGRPWWTIDQTTYGRHYKILEKNWKTIRDEGLALMDQGLGVFKEEAENLRDTGDWRVFMLYQRGNKVEEACMKCPKTCALLADFKAATGCTRGQIKYSVMMPGIHVWPHVGPTNCRIRAHLGLVVPEGPVIRVVNERHSWEEGKIFVFDDSFEHEVWHDGDSFRLVLIIDAWHPEIPEMERRTLSPI